MAQPQHYQQYPGRARPGQMYQQQQPGQLPYAQPGNYSQTPHTGYAHAQQYAPQGHIPPQPQASQQDPAQRYYSPAPQEQPTYTPSPYSAQSGGPPPSGPAAFHFIPGGVGPPPDQASSAIRRKPSPQSIPQQAPSAPLSEIGGPVAPYAAQTIMQNQVRPGSIHTLNSGNPQELATGGYESPIDNRRSYPPATALAQPSQQGSESYASGHAQQPTQGLPYFPYQQHSQAPQTMHPQHSGQAPQPMHPQSAVPAPLQPQSQAQRNDLSTLPSRQRTQSFESSYSGQMSIGADPTNFAASQSQLQQHTQPPAQPIGAPPGIPSSPKLSNSAFQQYQAYNPNIPPHRAPPIAAATEDPGDFYR